ncbi:MAG: glucosamine--fructose-6-phosphate aminotransferase (isomerizing) [Planctomycetota bacterium]|jgi:glucosamine--fructose-6-phosphate aminotransferase (isomerizing)
MGMREEMAEQPEVLRRMLNHGFDHITNVADVIAQREFNFAYIVARGSSDNAGLYAKYLLGAENGLAVGMAAPSLWTQYHQPPRLKNSLIIAISQSGESTDLIKVLEDARRQGATTVAISNSPKSPLASASEFVIDINAGAEHAIAATKTYTATLFALACLAAGMNKNEKLVEALQAVPDEVEAALELDAKAAQTASALRDANYCVVIGRGYNFATAYEWALKLKELAYIVAEPYSAADFRHGPLAIVGNGFPILGINVEGCVSQDVSVLLNEMKESKGARIFSAGNVQQDQAVAELSLPFACKSESTSPIAAVIPGQLLAWHLATVRGLDPNSPRGLSKVTKTS